MKIFIVDDSKLQRKKLRRTLEGMEFEVEEAGSGKEALEKIFDFEPDCLITDLLMPEMNGLDLVKNLNDQGFDKPMIVCSADVQSDTVDKCKEAGVAAFLNKPYKDDMIKQLVDDVMNK